MFYSVVHRAFTATSVYLLTLGAEADLPRVCWDQGRSLYVYLCKLPPQSIQASTPECSIFYVYWFGIEHAAPHGWGFVPPGLGVGTLDAEGGDGQVLESNCSPRYL